MNQKFYENNKSGVPSLVFIRGEKNKNPMTHRNTIRKHLEQKLEVYSVEELQTECKKVLKDLKQYPQDNKWQIRYYNIFWELLSEY